MTFIVPLAAAENTLTDMINDIFSTTMYMRLFATNVTINNSTTLATLLAAESTFTGYAKVALTTWGTVVADGSGGAQSPANSAIFTPTGSGGSGNIYGYFLTDSGGTILFGAESFSGGPVTVPQNISFGVNFTYDVISLH